jgi:hypothetical protein
MMQTVLHSIVCKRADIDTTISEVRRKNTKWLYVLVGNIDRVTARRLWKLFTVGLEHITIDLRPIGLRSLGLTHIFPVQSRSSCRSLEILGNFAIVSLFAKNNGTVFDLIVERAPLWKDAYLFIWSIKVCEP